MKKNFIFFAWIFFPAALISVLATAGCSRAPEPEGINIVRALSETFPNDCFQAASRPADIVFPRDSGPHNAFRTEWWYYTGNLETPEGRHFGYQLTFFRHAFSCEPAAGPSKWRTRQLYFSHYALTDTESGRFYSKFRMNRESLGIAGAQASPYRVWIDDWQVREKDGGLVLEASDEGIRLDLTLFAGKPVILQGDKGFSRKGPEPFNASYYYSLPDIKTSGKVEINGTAFPVRGRSWFDHEWSTSALSANTAGWDWFSIHLEDGRSLMLCRIRNREGISNGFGFGSLSRSDGRVRILSETEFQLSPTRYWKSPATEKRYPLNWEMSIPSEQLFLLAAPVIQNQEHTHMATYWEGAVRFTGKGIEGSGYIELTGY